MRTENRSNISVPAGGGQLGGSAPCVLREGVADRRTNRTGWHFFEAHRKCNAMKNDGLKAAAERLRRWDAGEASDKVYPHAVYSTACANDDAWSLARDFIARLADDERQAKEDAEPITEEWLASIGFANQTMNGWSKLFDGDGSICELFVSHEGDVSICQDSDHVTLSMMPRITTRGQLRKLLEALKGGA